MNDRTEQITIDGPAASGKSTVAKRIAGKLGAYYVNTGEMYRALTSVALARRIDPQSDQTGIIGLLEGFDLTYNKSSNGDKHQVYLCLNNQRLNERELRSPEVTEQVSFVARIPEVRAWMVFRQREARSLGLIVIEGRDIGTVIFPKGRHKFFVTATPEERARRRLAQGRETIDGATLSSVAAEIAKRDKIDSTRKIAPLKPAEDAIIIDTTDLPVEEIVDRMITIIKEHWAEDISE